MISISRASRDVIHWRERARASACRVAERCVYGA
jgi:hypothetical protein